jgi:hypothetical protein
MVGRVPKAGLRVFLGALSLATAGGASFLGIACALSLLRDSALFGSESLFLTSICASIAWLFVAVFHFGKETIYLPLHRPETFLANTRRVLQEMGYDVTRQNGDGLATRNGFQFLLFRRGMEIQCADRQARITGPKLWVDRLRRRLRVQNFLATTQMSLGEAQRLAGILLKRVEVRMRLTPENLEEVTRRVLQLLTREAEVVCEVNILAQSETGIREDTVDHDVRVWLNEQGITADIHKDLAKMPEPSSSVNLPAVRCKLPVV